MPTIARLSASSVVVTPLAPPKTLEEVSAPATSRVSLPPPEMSDEERTSPPT